MRDIYLLIHTFIFLIVTLLGVFLSGCESKKAPSREEKKIKIIDTVKHDSLFLKESQNPGHREKAYQIDEVIERLAKHRRFSGTVLVAEKEKIIYMGKFGKSRYNPDLKLTYDTPFHLASVSKQFTAMAIMKLQEEGKLSYDDSVQKYITEFPYAGVTIRHLLNHTSGLPRITDYIPYFLSVWDTCKIATNDDFTNMLAAKTPPLRFLPGRRFSYSNSGYIVLAAIVAKVSGKTFEEFIQENIFDPLEMRNSFVFDVKEYSHPDRAIGYSLYRNSYVENDDDIRNGLVGEKGIYSSVVDLYKWDRALYSEKVVRFETLREAFRRGKLRNGREINYGFGWRMPGKEDRVVYHFGYWRGFRTCIVRVLDDQFVIIILNNTSSRKIRFITQKILDIWYQDRNEKPKF